MITKGHDGKYGHAIACPTDAMGEPPQGEPYAGPDDDDIPF